MAQTGRLITVEGVEGVGKSTAMDYLKQLLRDHQISFQKTREPGGPPIAEAIRSLLLRHHEQAMLPDTEALLMFASRAQNIAEVIRPALARGEWVISDRFVDASFAYQGGGREVGEARIQQLSDWVLGDLKVDRVLLLDASPEVCLARMANRKQKDRIEKEDAVFFERTRAAYLARAAAHPDRFRVIRADVSLEKVQAQLADALGDLF